MKSVRFLSFHHKIIFIFILLLNVPFILTAVMGKAMMEKSIIREKEEKLLSIARILDSRLGPGGYEEILLEHGGLDADRETKIRILNRILTQPTDEVAHALEGIGTGYYVRDLEAIVTYGPSTLFSEAVGLTIAQDHPGRIVMLTNTELVSTGTMVRGDIMNAMRPISRNGKVIGYIWANEEVTDIQEQFSLLGRNIFLILSASFGLSLILLLLLSRRTMSDASRIIRGVREMRSDLSFRLEPASGELRDVASGINAMAEEISRAQDDTERTMAVLQSIMSNVDAVIFVCDPRRMTLIYANEYIRSLAGKESVEGELCYEVLLGRKEPCFHCPLRLQFRKDSAPDFSMARWETHVEGLNRDFLMTGRLMTWHDGSLVHIETGTDITERKALADAEAANLAQRDFLARMSHEIRTPMNGVLGMTHLAMQASPPPAQMEYLKKIQASASLLLGIINDILDFSRIEAGKLTIENNVFSLHAMIENITELIQPRVQENNLEFTVSMDPSVPEFAKGDELRLSQVLLNLLGNASKFTTSGFISLTVTARTTPADLLRLECTVRDSGIGMNERELQGLFKPFSQADSSTSRKFGGTGLGLSISKALVELMGGSITVSSEAGKGSVFTFRVELETADQPEERAKAATQGAKRLSLEGRKLLLVEDNYINQEIAQAILSEMGAEVDVAENGQEGFQAFLAKDYSMILMDVRMPVMDGLEATRKIRASDKHDASTVPIIAMTANAMKEDREASREAGMNAHVAKPIDLEELNQVLTGILKDD